MSRYPEKMRLNAFPLVFAPSLFRFASNNLLVIEPSCCLGKFPCI